MKPNAEVFTGSGNRGRMLADMPAPLCPECETHTTRQLMSLSIDSLVDYYRCDDCGHVFTTRKSTTDLLDHVTFDPLRASCPPYLRVKPERRRAT
jgi:hypothetical protein